MRTTKHFLFNIALASALFFGCKKADQINELTLPSSGRVAQASATNCDYFEAVGTRLFNPDDYTPYTIFTKTYEPGTNKIIKIKTAIIDQGLPGYNPDEITITYKGNTIICFSKNQNDTLANITLDPATKKPTSAIGRHDFTDPGSKGPFQFKYVNGRLTGIRFTGFFYQSHNIYYPYITIQYQDSRNIHQVYFGPDGTKSTQRLVYTYDKKTFFEGQFYADEWYYTVYNFWALIKQLNLLPELQPHYKLVKGYLYNTNYPGDEVYNYSNHQADASNKLISYTVAKHYAKYDEDGTPQNYTIKWQCNSAQAIK